MKEGEGHFLRSLMLCANLKVSRIATADKLYDHNTLPRDLNFKLAKNEKWEDKYAWIEPLPCDRRSEVLQSPPAVKPQKTTEKKVRPKPAIIPPKPKEELKTVPIPLINKENLSVNTPLKVETEKPVVIQKKDMNPLLVLQDVIGCSMNQCPTISWSKNVKVKEFAYGAGNLVVISELDGRKRFCTGHRKPVTALTIGFKGDIMASADESTVKVWSFSDSHCMGTWKLEDGARAKCLAISPDNSYLVTVAKDAHNHDVVTVWDLKTMHKMSPYQPHPNIVASQISQFNILCVKFAPPEESSLQFCTCGQENIRFWRIKRNTLRSAPVVLDKCSRNTVFTSLDYEGRRRVYVGSKEGTVLQINAESQELEYVYKLHDSGIYTLSVNEGFCVTGSDDQYLRVWPLDFSEFFMEAKHEATVVALDISLDGVLIVCGTDHGSVGLLDLSQQRYRTLARSHTNDILCLALDGDRLVSVSKDKTIRVWDLKTNQQAYEFCSFDDQALCAGLCPGKGFFACGFESGCLRIFDIERTSVIGEYRMFDKPLIYAKYIDNYLVTLAGDGSIAIHNANTYDAVKQILAETPVHSPCLAVQEKAGVFATTGKNSINLWMVDPLQIKHNIAFPTTKIQDMTFLSENILAVFTTDSCVWAYGLDGTLLFKRQVLGIPSGIVKMAASANGKYLAFIGPDSVIRVTSAPLSTAFQVTAPIELKEYAYHAGQVKSILFHPEDPTLAFTAAGAEGIFVWKFHGNVMPEVEGMQEELKTLSIRGDDVIREMRVPEKLIKVASELSVPITFEAEPVVAPLIKQNKRLAKRTGLKLPLKHYVSSHEDKQTFYEDLSTRTYTIADKNFWAQKITGYNGNAHDNIFYCQENGWIAFTLGHKLILEDFTSKKQEVYLEQEAEISTMVVSEDFKYLATATGIPNRTTNVADIMVYSISSSKPYLKPMKKLAFYQKGVQALCFSKKSSRELWTVGRHPESTVALWDVSTGVCLATEILSEPVHFLLEDSATNYIHGLSRNYIGRMRPDGVGKEYKLLVDRVRREGIEFTCAEQFGEVFLVGSTDGIVFVYDPLQGAIIGEYPVCTSEISCIACREGVLNIAAGNTVYAWKKATSAHILGLKPVEVKLDSDIVALTFKTQNELLAGTSAGSLYLILDMVIPVKLHSTQLDSETTAIYLPENPKIIVAAGTGSTVKIHSQQSFDLLAEYVLPDTYCSAFATIGELLVGSCSDGCIRFWSLKTLKQLGKTHISSAGLTAMCGKERTLIMGNEIGVIFVATFLSIEPISASLQKIESDLEGAITSIDFSCSPLIAAASSKGDIVVWEVVGKLPGETLTPRGSCELKERDKWNIFENPHGVEVSAEDLLIYKEKQRHNVMAVVLKEDPDVLICGCDSLQYLYVRDMNTHQIQKRIVIDVFPMKIMLLPIHNWAAIGGTDGTIKLKNMENLEEENVRVHYSSVQAMEVFLDGTHIVTGAKGEMIKWAIELDNQQLILIISTLMHIQAVTYYIFIAYSPYISKSGVSN
eukprot:TRINITY_DN2893_c0_g1_i1.p1 TRINITY_DN2893_c0_g1~~TRINITY_DN2893_c0_g1_i1.p1  ORF type:complete len:1515 (+),score=148.49 TRINITY_DN2893_c0_g1_i1:576-5120(+)